MEIKHTPIVYSWGLWALLCLAPISCADESHDCQDACGEIPSQDYICGEDGWVYEGECQLACHGLDVAQDDLLCVASRTGRCGKSDKGRTHYHIEFCGELSTFVCDGERWVSADVLYCGSPKDYIYPCFADCPPCPEDEAEFICGKKGARYCNACVMACLEDEAGDSASCDDPVSPAGSCNPKTDRNATRQAYYGIGYGCNTCECAASGLWHCTFWACPGEETFP